MQGVLLQQESNANQISVKALDKGITLCKLFLTMELLSIRLIRNNNT